MNLNPNFTVMVNLQKMSAIYEVINGSHVDTGAVVMRTDNGKNAIRMARILNQETKQNFIVFSHRANNSRRILTLV